MDKPIAFCAPYPLKLKLFVDGDYSLSEVPDGLEVEVISEMDDPRNYDGDDICYCEDGDAGHIHRILTSTEERWLSVPQPPEQKG